MQGRHYAHPQLFAYTDIERLIPANHLLRKINKVLDLSFVREPTIFYYCDDNGRPSIDPEVFFRMQVIIYLYGIDSDRQLCEEIQVSLVVYLVNSVTYFYAERAKSSDCFDSFFSIFDKSSRVNFHSNGLAIFS
jgi:hypothetical protein